MKPNQIAILTAMVLLSLTTRAQPIQPELLVTFFGTNGASPQGTLTLGSDGNFYGTTYRGGAADFGTVFRLTTSGTLTTLVSFNNTNGALPFGTLTQAGDGNLYGATLRGGSNDFGTLFQVTTNGDLTSLISFDSPWGTPPAATLTLGADGDLYGTTDIGGLQGFGSVFKLTSSGALTTLFSFDGTIGAHPGAALTLGNDGQFYGTTKGGYIDVNGKVFRVTTNGTLTILASFDSGNGSSPQAPLALGRDGNFYGTTSAGGSNNSGTVFKVTTNGILTTLVSFDNANGASPQAALFLDNDGDGNCFGTTDWGGSGGGYGTVFKVAANGTLTTLVSFNFGIGANPQAALALGGDGNFYGTTASGGSGALGTVFRLSGPPVFLIQPQPATQVVPAGVNVEISASGFGTFPLAYRWFFNSTNLIGATNASLILINVAPSMSGNYWLQMTNRVGGPISSSNASLTVLPAILTSLPAVELTTTGATLRGSATLGPVGTQAWFEWGTDRNYGQVTGLTNLPALNTTVALSNILNGLSGDLVYHYRLAASNSYGVTYGGDQSFQIGLKPSVSPLGVAGNTTNLLTLLASVNPGGRSTAAWFEWGATANYGNSTPVVSVGSGATTSSLSNQITGFSLNALYHFRPVASNSLGVTIGGDATFLVGAPLAVTEPATSVTGTNAWINGLVTPNSLPTAAWFEWGTNTSYGNVISLGQFGIGSGGQLASSFLNNLDPAVTYHFRVAASNSLGSAVGTDAQISVPLDAYARSVLTDQPMLYYRFDEASGATVLNSGTTGAAGNGTYNATVSLGNPSLVPAFGLAAGFSNSNSMIAVPALGTFNQVTIEVWARPRSFAVANPSSPNHSGYNSIYTADNYVSGALHTHFINSSPSQQWQLAISPSDFDIVTGNAGYFPSNAWVHLVATHDSPAHRTIAYVNGRAIATNNSSTTVPVNLAAAHIGNWVGHENWFDGQLDEFALYGTVLPASRIQAHYQAAIGDPVLNSQKTTNKLTFSWAGPGFRLQSNTNLASAAGWTNVPAGSNSPVSVTLSNSGNRFFRLKWP